MINKALTAVSEVENAYHTWKTRPLASRKETGVQKEIDNIPHISTKGQLLFTYVHTPFAENDSLPNVYLYLVNKNIELIAKITTKKEIKEYFWKDEHTIFFKFFDHQVNGIKIITQR